MPTPHPHETVIRNVWINLATQLAPLFIGFLAIRLVFDAVGAERFGLLSLVWAFLSYFTLVDLGVGRATIKFLSEALGSQRYEGIPGLVWTSVAAQLVLGVVGGGGFAVLAPLLAGHVLNFSPAMAREGSRTFYILAALIPVSVISTAFRGLLEAGQRYDLVGIVRLPLNSLTFAIPALVSRVTPGIDTMTAFFLIGNLVAALGYLVLSLRLYPALRHVRLDISQMRGLFGYGSWLTVAHLVWSLMLQVDRVMIGALLTVAAVAPYAVAYEFASRLWILSSSMVPLFPAFSTLGLRWAEVPPLYGRGLRYLLLLLGGVTGGMLLVGEPLLRFWLGPSYTEASTVVLKVLAIGVFVSGLAVIPDLTLKALGSPDVVAKVYMILLPVYVVGTAILLRYLGIVGVAVAWTARATAESTFLFLASRRYLPDDGLRRVGQSLARLVILVVLLWAGVSAAGVLATAPALMVGGIMLAVFLSFGWKVGLEEEDRRVLQSVAYLWRQRGAV